MKRLYTLSVILGTFAVIAAGSAALGQEVAVAAADGSQQVPAIISAGAGVLVASISEDMTRIAYQVEYRNTQGSVLQSHLHIGQPGINGGIMLFVCTNLGNGPDDPPPCPGDGGTVNGVWTIDDVVAVPNQGLGGGPFSLRRAIKAMRSGIAYLNIHTDQYPGGEIRGEVTVLSAKEAEALSLGLDN